MSLEKEPKSVIRPTDDQARQLAKELIRTARFGALAVLEAETRHPFASRVAVATDLDGTPVILTSSLSGHTTAILADPSCSLLLGEPGKGDPLAHPRISLLCSATKISKESAEHGRLRKRYLSRHPKAELYVDFGDFSFFRLSISRASLNGGFGKAFELEKQDLQTPVRSLEDWSSMEEGAVAHMNSDHRDAVKLYAQNLLNAGDANWRIGCLDPEGIDLVAGDRVQRLWFAERLEEPSELRPALVALALQARNT
ncbi:HugZ family pyridoxamine 5'-phosphate oxidase [Roseibium sp. LAB1]